MKFSLPTRAIAALLALACSAATAKAQGQVNIYSYREPKLMEPLFEAFTKSTGIKVNVVFANAGLNERLAAEGALSPADLLLTVDASRLIDAKDAGLTQAIAAPVITAAPPAYRDAENHWTALTLRARVVFASKERVKLDAITYDDLADPKWRGKLCIRSGQHSYNTSLVASIVAHKGEAAAETWLRGVKANLARKPAGGDREAVRDVHTGQCDLAIANTYYMAAMLANPAQKPWADSVTILFPDAAGRGSHVNVSGVALAKHAKNKPQAEALIAFLLSDSGQSIYASINNEYPVTPSVAPSSVVKAWGTLKPDALPLSDLAKNRKAASNLVDKVGFDAGP